MIKNSGVEDNCDLGRTIAKRVCDFYSCFSLFRKESLGKFTFLGWLYIILQRCAIHLAVNVDTFTGADIYRADDYWLTGLVLKLELVKHGRDLENGVGIRIDSNCISQVLTNGSDISDTCIIIFKNDLHAYAKNGFLLSPYRNQNGRGQVVFKTKSSSFRLDINYPLLVRIFYCSTQLDDSCYFIQMDSYLFYVLVRVNIFVYFHLISCQLVL